MIDLLAKIWIRARNWLQEPLRLMAKRREYALLTMIVLMVLIIELRSPEYLLFKNLNNVFYNLSFLGILALGQLPVLLSRGIDLSQAAILALCGMALALLSQQTVYLPPAVYCIMAIMLGSILGAVNGALISLLKIPPIITTLGTMSIYRGLVYLLSGGAWVSSFEMSQQFKLIGSATLARLPMVFYILVVSTAVIAFFLVETRSGRNIYAIGGNPVAARNAGISQKRAEMTVYILSGATAGLCGYLWTAHFAIAYTQSAQGRIFAIIAACVIGGISISGGKGTVLGAVLGALFITVIDTALPFLRISPFAQLYIIGAVILFAVAANASAEKPSGRRILREVQGDER